MWDIAGQDRFSLLSRSFYSDAAGAFIVSDLTRPETLEAVIRWKEELDAKVRRIRIRRAANETEDESSSNSNDEASKILLENWNTKRNVENWPKNILKLEQFCVCLTCVQNRNVVLCAAAWAAEIKK